MSEHDDIDFDFFGDSEPEPPKKRLVRRPSGPRDGGGSPPPRRPATPPHGGTPAVRLVSLIAFAIALILILIFAVRSCESSSENAAYKNYMDEVAKIASSSQSAGKSLSALLDKQELSESVVETTLKGLISQEGIDVQNAQKLTPPGPLRNEHEQMVEALQLRQNSLSGLLAVFKKTMSKHGSTAATKAGVALSQQMLRGVASDVLWQDMFVTPAQAVLKQRGISGVAPPSSVFVADSQRATYNSMQVVWQRFHGVQSTNTSGTVHGTDIAYVKVLPSGKILNAAITETIKTSDRLAFAVGVENGGDYLEQNIVVTLKIGQTPNPIVRKMKIAQIYSKAKQEVVFKSLNISELANKIPVSVDVARVPGEVRISNNVATYEVMFTF
jgi:hypothetical protein